MVDINELPKLYPAQVCMLTTGSQGEPLSALTRMAYGDHKQIQIQPGDTVLLSSKFIPGNELSIQRIINQLYRHGADVYYEKVSEIHVSGHASREELALMITLVKPKYFMPVHGETRHLIQHARLAEHLGLPPENVIVAHDGDVVEFRSDGVRKTETVEVGRVFVDGKGVGDVEDIVLRDRKHLSENGMVIAILVIKARTGEIVYGPDVSTRGVTLEEDRPELLQGAKEAVAEFLNDAPPEIKSNVAELKAEIHRVLRRYFNRELDRRPVILPVIIEL
jgi:ribonuclease J